MRWYLILIEGLFLCTSCNIQTEKKVQNSRQIVQVSVIDGLLQGMYDGFYPIGDLHQMGNYGIGTFDALDGEMIMYNDTIFQIVSSGDVLLPDSDLTTPFATVTFFQTDTVFTLTNITFDSLKSDFNHYFPTPNIFYAVKISGTFKMMKTRSVPKQAKPFLPLVQVTATQPEFDFEEVTGDIFGFYCPEYAKGINVPGLHLHFLNSTRTSGGHILEFNLKSGTLEIGYLLDYRLILPEGGDFYGGNFTLDRSGDLEEAEN